mmetsp:Transcript_564/g.730  ORF Transcript_564/g.730 Transcript_564/m.730 type:complete len:275 (-) Transcript_564:1068-1892(-)
MISKPWDLMLLIQLLKKIHPKRSKLLMKKIVMKILRYRLLQEVLLAMIIYSRCLSFLLLLNVSILYELSLLAKMLILIHSIPNLNVIFGLKILMLSLLNLIQLMLVVNANKPKLLLSREVVLLKSVPQSAVSLLLLPQKVVLVSLRIHENALPKDVVSVLVLLLLNSHQQKPHHSKSNVAVLHPNQVLLHPPNQVLHELLHRPNQNHQPSRQNQPNLMLLQRKLLSLMMMMMMTQMRIWKLLLSNAKHLVLLVQPVAVLLIIEMSLILMTLMMI